MPHLIRPLPLRLTDGVCAACLPLVSAAATRVRCVAGCRQGSSNMEYAVFAGMIGMTLLIMFQLFGDSLIGTFTAVLHRLQATIDGAHPGGGH